MTVYISNVPLDLIAGGPAAVFTVTDVFRAAKVYDSAANSDPDGDSDGTTISIDPPSPPPPPISTATTVAVADIDGSSVFTSSSRWQATITISLVDDNGNSVANVNIMARWSGGKYGNAYCKSNASGTCTLLASNVSKSRRYVKLKVMVVSHATLSYNASANSDPDGDSDGTTIKVYRP